MQVRPIPKLTLKYPRIIFMALVMGSVLLFAFSSIFPVFLDELPDNFEISPLINVGLIATIVLALPISISVTIKNSDLPAFVMIDEYLKSHIGEKRFDIANDGYANIFSGLL